MVIEFKDVCTNLRHYDNFAYKNYSLSKNEADAILRVDDESDRLCKIRELVNKADFDERNTDTDYKSFYEQVKEIVE